MPAHRSNPSPQALYRRAHDRVRYLKGKASAHDCRMCAGDALDWALKPLADCVGDLHVVKVRNSPMWFSTLPEDYQPLCRSCHRGADAAARRSEKVWSE